MPVYIRVLDINDNAPTFANNYETFVCESAKANQVGVARGSLGADQDLISRDLQEEEEVSSAQGGTFDSLLLWVQQPRRLVCVSTFPRSFPEDPNHQRHRPRRAARRTPLLLQPRPGGRREVQLLRPRQQR